MTSLTPPLSFGAVHAPRDHVRMGERRRGAIGWALSRIGGGRGVPPPASAERVGWKGGDRGASTRAPAPAVDDAELDTLRAELVRELARLAGPPRR